MAINIPPPNLQIEFSSILTDLRATFLQDALRLTVQEMDITLIDQELAEYVPREYLALLAGKGLRGELLFPTPSILKANPQLLGYYRLLLGFSQKVFYKPDFGLSGYANLEMKGIIPEDKIDSIPELCVGLINSAVCLLESLSESNIAPSFFDDLTLLTLGPQLRGGANVKKGIVGINAVFQIIKEIVKDSAVTATSDSIEIRNAANRKVNIAFSPDPDIVIQEQMTTGQLRNIIAIEVKAGKDFSNIHNRIGEAEKSHQKAKLAGYVECWTVVNVDNMNVEMAKTESPSTNRFYILSNLLSQSSTEYSDFRDRIISLTGIITPDSKEDVKRKARRRHK